MRLVKFLRRGFHNHSIVEAGETMLIDEKTVLGDHMLDVESGLTGPQMRQSALVRYRPDLAAVPPPPPAPLQVEASAAPLAPVPEEDPGEPPAAA